MFSQGWSRQKCSCHRSRPLPSVEGGWFQDWNETLNNPERGRECRDRLPSRALCCGLQAMACPGGGLLQRRRGAQWGPCPPCSPLSGPLLNFPSPHQSQRGPQGEGILLCPFFFFFFFLSLLIPYQGSSFLSPPREKWLPFSVLFIYLLDSLGSELRHMGSLLHYAGSFIVA